MVGGAAYCAAIRLLWDGRCTVTVRRSAGTDEKTGRAFFRETDIYQDEPCRLSYESVSTVEPTSGAARTAQSVTLFTARTLEAPPGSKITVTQDGATGVYEQSGKPAVYSTHKEIPLELFKGWA